MEISRVFVQIQMYVSACTLTLNYQVHILKVKFVTGNANRQNTSVIINDSW